MPHVFGFALEASHQARLDALIDAHAQGTYSSPETLSELAIMGTEGVVRVLALDVIQILKEDKEGGSILETAANLVMGTMKALLKQLLGKVDNSEQDKLSAYMLRRRIDTPQGRLFGYGLDDADGRQFQQVLAGACDTVTPQTREALTAILIRFIDLTTVYCYDEFIECLDLGMIKRKLTSVARSTIQKAGHMTIHKLIKSLSDEQIRRVSQHYQRMFLSL